MQQFPGRFDHESVKVLPEGLLKLRAIDGERLQQLIRHSITSNHRQQNATGPDGVVLLIDGMINRRLNHILDAGRKRELGEQV